MAAIHMRQLQPARAGSTGTGGVSYLQQGSYVLLGVALQ